MRALAVLALLLIQDSDVDALLKQLEDESIEVREKAAAALVELGDKAEARVKKHLADAGGEVKARCESLLHSIRVMRSRAFLMPPLKHVTIDAKDAKLRELLADLRQRTGMALTLKGLPDLAVTVQVKDATPFEAFDAVCVAADLDCIVRWDIRVSGPEDAIKPAIGGGPAEPHRAPIWFAPGCAKVRPLLVRQYAVAPFLLHIARWTDFRQKVTHSVLKLRLSWTPDMHPETAEMDIASVLDDKGRPLYKSAKGGRDVPGFQAWREISRGMIEYTIPVAFPEADARSLSSVRGTARMTYLRPEKVACLDHPETHVGQKQDYDGVTVEVRSFQTEKDAVRFALSLTGSRGRAVVERAVRPPDLPIMDRDVYCDLVRARLEDGAFAPLMVSGSSRNVQAGVLVLTLANAAAKIASLEIVTDWSFHEDAFDFELKDIPIPR